MASKYWNRAFRMLLERGMKVDDLAVMSDEQIGALLPELMPVEKTDEHHKTVAECVKEWKQTHAGEPDYFRDILPMITKRQICQAQQK